MTNNETSLHDFKIEIKKMITPTQTNSLTKITFIHQIILFSNYRPYGSALDLHSREIDTDILHLWSTTMNCMFVSDQYSRMGLG